MSKMNKNRDIIEYFTQCNFNFKPKKQTLTKPHKKGKWRLIWAENVWQRLIYVALLDSNDPSVTFQDKGSVGGISGLSGLAPFKMTWANLADQTVGHFLSGHFAVLELLRFHKFCQKPAKERKKVHLGHIMKIVCVFN